MEKNTFTVVFINDDNKKFSFIENIVDDEKIIERTIMLQNKGNNIRIETTTDSNASIRNNMRFKNYKYDKNTVW